MLARGFTMACRSCVIAFLCLCIPSAIQAVSQGDIEFVTAQVIKVCDRPNDRGSLIKLRGTGNLGARLTLLRKGIDGDLSFDLSKEEYENVERNMLGPDRASYRTCALPLMTLLLDKLEPEPVRENNIQVQTATVFGVGKNESVLGQVVSKCNKSSCRGTIDVGSYFPGEHKSVGITYTCDGKEDRQDLKESPRGSGKVPFGISCP